MGETESHSAQRPQGRGKRKKEKRGRDSGYVLGTKNHPSDREKGRSLNRPSSDALKGAMGVQRREATGWENGFVKRMLRDT